MLSKDTRKGVQQRLSQFIEDNLGLPAESLTKLLEGLPKVPGTTAFRDVMSVVYADWLMTKREVHRRACLNEARWTTANEGEKP